jgi:hypothetical protein
MSLAHAGFSSRGLDHLLLRVGVFVTRQPAVETLMLSISESCRSSASTPIRTVSSMDSEGPSLLERLSEGYAAPGGTSSSSGRASPWIVHHTQPLDELVEEEDEDSDSFLPVSRFGSTCSLSTAPVDKY